MKKFFLSLAFFISLASQAQVGDIDTEQMIDTGTLNVTITLKARNHFDLIGLMEGLSHDLRKVNYIGQVAKLSAVQKDTAQMITVSVPAGLVADLYLEMGARQERLTSLINANIKKALQPQLMASPVGFWILKQIVGIDKRNAALIEQVIDKGFQIVSQFKQ